MMSLQRDQKGSHDAVAIPVTHFLPLMNNSLVHIVCYISDFGWDLKIMGHIEASTELP